MTNKQKKTVAKNTMPSIIWPLPKKDFNLSSEENYIIASFQYINFLLSLFCLFVLFCVHTHYSLTTYSSSPSALENIGTFLVLLLLCLMLLVLGVFYMYLKGGFIRGFLTSMLICVFAILSAIFIQKTQSNSRSHLALAPV